MNKVYNVLVLRQKEIFENIPWGGVPKVREDNTGVSHRAYKLPPPPSLPVLSYLIRAAEGKG